MGTNNMRKSNKGFSLVEMLVVVAILAIIATMSVSCFYLTKNATITGAAQDVENQINKAKTQAMTIDYNELFVEFYVSDENKLCSYIGWINPSNEVVKVAGTSLAMGKNVGLKVVDSEGNSIEVSDSVYCRIYFNKRSGGVVAVKNSNDIDIKTANSTYADLTIYYRTGGYDRECVRTLNYTSGTINK